MWKQLIILAYRQSQSRGRRCELIELNLSLSLNSDFPVTFGKSKLQKKTWDPEKRGLQAQLLKASHMV